MLNGQKIGNQPLLIQVPIDDRPVWVSSDPRDSTAGKGVHFLPERWYSESPADSLPASLMCKLTAKEKKI